ncbi:transposase, partial [bacterium]|nr:transposase [bacterium]
MEDSLNEARNQTISWLLEQPLDVKQTLLRHHVELARILFNEIIEMDVRQYAGKRYSHDKPHHGRYSRWGSNPGSIRVGSEKVPVKVTRVHDTHGDKFISLESYEQMHQLPPIDEKLSDAVLLGLSTSDYGRVAEAFTDGFGLSQSTVSRRFIESATEQLEAFEKRSLKELDFVALIIDGKEVAKHQIVIALGITLQGDKVPLGFIQAGSENANAVKGLLQSLIKRDFAFDQGILCIIDGSKGLYKAVKQVFGAYSVVQRCQWHKRENVLSYLNESDHKTYKTKLQHAYELFNYR